MNNELAKTVSTCAIWLSVACVLTFGVFKLNASGEMVVFLVFFCLPILIVGAAVKATTEIWKNRAENPLPRAETPAAAPAVTSAP